jgi:hypothetical protein
MKDYNDFNEDALWSTFLFGACLAVAIMLAFLEN